MSYSLSLPAVSNLVSVGLPRRLNLAEAGSCRQTYGVRSGPLLPNDLYQYCALQHPWNVDRLFVVGEDAAMDEANIAQLIFALSVAREMASLEGPEFDLVVHRVQQAIDETRDKALRYGIVIEIDPASTRTH